MGTFSIWHILVVLVVILVLFGKGRISGMMEDLGKGIKSFKKGMAEDEAAQPKQIDKKDDTTTGA
jgi:sec-independent protein translocase protein TatA